MKIAAVYQVEPCQHDLLVLLPFLIIEEGHGGAAWLLVPPPGWR